MRIPFGLGICGLVLAGMATHAIAPPEQPGMPASALPAPENAVLSIPSAHRISEWQPLDTRHVVVSVDSQDRYLLTLREVCPGLNYARSVGVTMSNNTIWAGFDAITTDSSICEIKRIDRLEGAPKRATKAGSAPDS